MKIILLINRVLADFNLILDDSFQLEKTYICQSDLIVKLKYYPHACLKIVVELV